MIGEKNRINAYTLMEVAVAMLLAAICISICYSAYSLIGSYFGDFELRNKNAQDILTLETTLARDLDKGHYIVRTDDGIAVKQDSLTISYRFNGAKIVRDALGLRTDSFDLAATEAYFRFEGSAAALGDTVDHINLVLQLEKGARIPLVLKKNYSSQDLFR
ncbi:hypothetical protein ACS5PU_02205 [Pedobacter sp. GSP4]|uniref:hypothetical protein n=1 Tax=Pedobacter sp. GSP4 TaxID=3453716 RepID=UPI003EEB2A81